MKERLDRRSAPCRRTRRFPRSKGSCNLNTCTTTLYNSGAIVNEPNSPLLHTTPSSPPVPSGGLLILAAVSVSVLKKRGCVIVADGCVWTLRGAKQPQANLFLHSIGKKQRQAGRHAGRVEFARNDFIGRNSRTSLVHRGRQWGLGSQKDLLQSVTPLTYSEHCSERKRPTSV